jgi:hypothetical protein
LYGIFEPCFYLFIYLCIYLFIYLFYFFFYLSSKNASPFFVSLFTLIFLFSHLSAVLGERTEIALLVGDADGDRVNCTDAMGVLHDSGDTWDGLEVGIRQDQLTQVCQSFFFFFFT